MKGKSGEEAARLRAFFDVLRPAAEYGRIVKIGGSGNLMGE